VDARWVALSLDLVAEDGIEPSTLGL
jgi:hypothetical protein